MIMRELDRIVLKALNQTRARLATLKTKRRICREGPLFLDELRTNLGRLCNLLGNAVDNDPIMTKLAERLERSQVRFHRLDALAIAEWEALRHDVSACVSSYRTFPGRRVDRHDRGRAGRGA